MVNVRLNPRVEGNVIIARLLPNFDVFLANHPWVGPKVGGPQTLPSGGLVQQFQSATAYGRVGGETHEVHGAIRDKYSRFGSSEGGLGYPVSDETGTPDGKGRFNHFEQGSIYWHPSTGAFEVHGAIRDRWATLGWERSWLGYPTSDELDLGDGQGGRVSAFQNGSIYWWPDTGARDINNIVLHYTGLHCFGETDVDEGSDSDEPYATIGTSGPASIVGTFRTQIYQDVNPGQGRSSLACCSKSIAAGIRALRARP
jgi:hypothetical protein